MRTTCRAALAIIFFYKAAISPLLPRSCRFLPTCSSVRDGRRPRAPLTDAPGFTILPYNCSPV